LVHRRTNLGRRMPRDLSAHHLPQNLRALMATVMCSSRRSPLSSVSVHCCPLLRFSAPAMGAEAYDRRDPRPVGPSVSETLGMPKPTRDPGRTRVELWMRPHEATYRAAASDPSAPPHSAHLLGAPNPSSNPHKPKKFSEIPTKFRPRPLAGAF
jgi:hypothetical protein